MSAAAIGLALVLLAGNALFVAAEFALVAARREQLAERAADGERLAALAVRSMDELSLTLAGAQLGITVCSIGLGRVTEPALAGGLEAALGALLGEPPALPAAARGVLAAAIAVGVVAMIHLVVGDLAPKSWAISRAERVATAVALPFRVFVTAARPVVWTLNHAANAVVRAVGVTPREALAGPQGPAELLALAREAAEHGELAGDEAAMLRGALQLSDLDAEAAMVPRPDVVTVDGRAGVDLLERTAAESGRSRLPVCVDGDLDRLVGVVHVRDVLAVAPWDRDRTSAADLADPALVVPESLPLADLLVQMRAGRQHVALVVDEHGTITGLITLEDVLEELIGEFADESDRRPAEAGLRTDGALVVPGRLRPDEAAERTGVDLPVEGVHETVAGLVIAELGRLPEPGDAVEVGSARLEVTRMRGPRVVEVAVRRLPRSPAADPEA